jgi:hypothetical protein
LSRRFFGLFDDSCDDDELPTTSFYSLMSQGECFEVPLAPLRAGVHRC